MATMDTLILQVPKRKHSSIIGRGGSVIRGLQEKHHIKITIPRNNDPSCGVILEGATAHLTACHHELERLVGCKLGTEVFETQTLDIPAHKYGVIIGPRGSTINRLSSTYGVSINVPRNHDEDVKVTGSHGQIQGLCGELEKLLHMSLSIADDGEHVEAKEATVALPAHSEAPLAVSLFFPDTPDSIDAKAPSGNFDTFLAYLRSAQQSMDICVFTISDDRISRVIKDQHRAGVRIRIITDDETQENQGSDIAEFKAFGVPVKTDHSKFHMHHKFVILDGKVLVNGSFNWTTTASRSNQENLMILNTPSFVSSFQREFDQLWQQF